MLLQVLLKWGEYSNDVQFILQHSNSNPNSNTSSAAGSDISQPITPERNKDNRKSLNFSHYRIENIGIVKGIPKQMIVADSKLERQSPSDKSDDKLLISSLNIKVQVG